MENEQFDYSIPDSEKVLQTVFDASFESIIVFDPNGRVIKINETASERIGLPKESIEGFTPFDLFPHAIAKPRHEKLQEVLRDGKPLLFKDQRANMEFEHKFVPVVSDDGSIQKVVVFSREMSALAKSSNAIRDSEERFSVSFNLSNIGMCMVGLDYQFLRINRAFCEMVGYDEEELISGSFKQVTHPDDIGKNEKETEQLLSGEINSFSVEKRYLHKEGHMLWGNLSVYTVRDVNDEPMYYLAHIENITSRKEMEEELQSERNKLHSVIQAMDSGLAIMDPSYTVIFQNEVMSKNFDGVGKNCYSAYLSRGKKCDNCPVEMAFNDGKSHTVVKELRQVSGKTIYWEIVANPIRNAKGEITSCLEISRNITARKSAEDAFRESEVKLNSLMDNSTSIIYIKNAQFKYSLINRSFENLLGVKKEHALGKKDDELFDKSTAEKLSANDSDVFFSKISTKFEHSLLINGKLIPYLTIKFPLVNSVGEVYAVGSMSTDVSEMRKVRHQLMQSQKLSSIGTFVAGIAHELNNPLTVILGYSKDLQSEQGIPDSVNVKLDIINKQAERTALIVHELLKFSSMHKPGKKDTNITSVLDAVIGYHISRFKTEGMKIIKEYGIGFPSLVADVSQLQQVFMNIITNAFQSMHKSGKGNTLKVKSEYDLEKKEIIIIFENNGPLIPENVLPQIFDPFFTTNPVGEGTGLGLSLCFGLIKEHEGSIGVENVDDSLVRFTITLPLTHSVENQEPEYVYMKEDLVHNIRCLLVEDDEFVREYLQLALSKKGVTVTTARNGKEAVDILRDVTFDLIVSDMRMEEMDGVELLIWLSENKPEYLKRFILATGVIDKDVVGYSEKYGCKYIMKPFSEDDLIQLMAETRVNLHQNEQH